MSRSSSPAIRWCVLGVFVALITALGWSALAPASADAQDSDDPKAALVVSEPAPQQPFRTVALALEAGNVGLAALSGDLLYDTDAINVLSCEVSEAGACNVAGEGIVRMSVFNLSGLSDNDRLLTVNFEVAPGASGTSAIAFDFDVVVNHAVADLPDIAVTSLDFVAAPVQYGSLTGDVVAADSQTGLFAIDVCAVHTVTQAEICIISTGLGTWRIDDLVVGEYLVNFSDPGDTYGTATVAATVTADDILTGLDAALGFATDVVEDGAAAPDSDDGDTPAPVPSPVVDTTPVVIYEASIAGRISAKDTAEPLEGLTVCATQPLVLHQSCGATDANGVYGLADLSAGNYWVSVVDPLGRFQDAPVTLVGVVGDTGARENVKIQLDRIAG